MSDERGAQTERVEARYIAVEMDADDMDNPLWASVRPLLITKYWSGEEAPAERHAEVRLLWSEEALYVRFDCPQREPLVVSGEPQTERKTLGLWDRDVCEIFIAPDVREPERYFEFEAAPTGEWVDLAIRWTPEGRATDWEFDSGMTTAARILLDRIRVSIRIPWKALGRAPRAGERWRANLFRCVGSGDARGYLAWQPTRTEKASFHVPSVFGWIEFKGKAEYRSQESEVRMG